MFSRKVLSFVLVLTLIFSCFMLWPSAEASQNLDLANKLKTLNLFLGSDQGFELDKDFTREQSVVMVLRLQALEKIATNQKLKSVFSDVPSGHWAESQIAYANSIGITKGIGNNKFGLGSKVTANQFVTYILRALGYDDSKGDFQWDKSIDKALEIGLLTSTEVKYFKTKATTAILRDDVVALAYNSLKTKLKNSDKTLLKKLLEAGAVTVDLINATRDEALIKAMMATPTSTHTNTPTITPTPTALSKNAFAVIEAESFNSKSGIETGVCTEGGQDIEWIENGDYVVYNGVDFGSGASGFDARVASGASGGNIEIRIDSIGGKVIGTCAVTSTGGWQSWTTKSCNITGATGKHDLYLKFTGNSGYLFSLNWFKFAAVSPTPAGVVFSDNFNDGNSDGWVTYGGAWSVENKQYGVNPNSEGKSIVSGSSYTNFIYTADVTVGTAGTAGIIFDVTNPATGIYAFSGYYVGIDANNGRIDLVRMNSTNTYTTLQTAWTTIKPYTANVLKVVRLGNSIKVYLNDMNTPRIDVNDGVYLSGAVGLRAVDSHASFDDVSVNLNTASTPTPTPTPTSLMRNPDSPGYTVNGLDYRYYEGYWDALPNFNSVSIVKNGVVNNFDLSVRNREDYFGFSYTGYINISTAGNYTFYTTSDDGSRLYIGNQMIVDNDGKHDMIEKNGTIALSAGKHAITVYFFDNTSAHGLEVRYSGPGVAKTLIPNNVLFRSAPTPTTTPTSTNTPTPTRTSTPTPISTSTPTNTPNYLATPT